MKQLNIFYDTTKKDYVGMLDGTEVEYRNYNYGTHSGQIVDSYYVSTRFEKPSDIVYVVLENYNCKQVNVFFKGFMVDLLTKKTFIPEMFDHKFRGVLNEWVN